MELQQERFELTGLPKKSLLRPDEVASFLSVSLKTIYRWHEMGVIEGTKLQKVLRIYRDSVVKLISENDSALQGTSKGVQERLTKMPRIR